VLLKSVIIMLRTDRTVVVVAAVGIAAVAWLGFLGHKSFPVHHTGGILVTGADDSGIGRDAAISLAKKGYVVYAGVRRPTDATSISDEKIDTLVPVIIDVTKSNTILAAFEFIKLDLARKKLPLIGLVNNAWVIRSTPVEFLKIDDARWNFEVNYFGLIAVTQQAIPLLRAAGGGSRIVQASSIAGILAIGGGNPYSATRFAVESLSQSLRLELSPWDISVSIINPGYIATKNLENVVEQRANADAAQQKLYPHILGDAVLQNEQRLMKQAPTTEVTTTAIEDAIMSPTPQIRYVLGAADGVSFSTVKRIKDLLPERIFDKILSLPPPQQ